MKQIWLVGLLIVLVAVGFFWFQGQAQTVEVYFNQSLPTDIKQMPVERRVGKNLAEANLIKATLDKLIQGPTSAETTSGLMTVINPATKVQAVELDSAGGVMVDFSTELNDNVAGSATVLAIRNQIEKTVLQFEFVKVLWLT